MKICFKIVNIGHIVVTAIFITAVQSQICPTSLRYGCVLWTETLGRWWRQSTCLQTLSFVSIMPMPMKTKVN